MKNILWQSFLCLANEDSNPVLRREEENKIVCHTHRLLLDLVAISLVFFFSSFFDSVLLFNKNFSLDESRKKGKKKVNCQSFTPFFLSAFVPFSFPTCLWLAAFLCYPCFCFLTSGRKSFFAWFLLSRHYILIFVYTYYY